ncbi:MAG TPA: WecB/TagA/CpsF family glycosyltransferase [Pirellulaceae bacterium]|nr:WecB/TagA/CpsF family glycosyltransferase [Pirellulaceae bacterium]HMO92720.1 WecB/TagA/CpsF family glycosyltransferase [Pirellulaceae bacterium]HMP70272.1 WecB/TagA/CpsF family glycosyltransferase [Pirellulaceae bacterium]
MDAKKKNLLGVKLDAVDYSSAVELVMEAAQAGRAFGVSALAVHGVMTGVFDPVHRHRLNQLELVVPDGQPVRWGLNLLHRVGLRDRVYGPNLMLKVCAACAKQGLPIFLFGSTPDVMQHLVANLQAKFPELRIAGHRVSRFRTMDASEKQELVEEIKQSGAKITFVGLGCPRQEVWAYEFKDDLSMPILAVGAAFAFHAGMLKQAPPLMQRFGLEWLFRLGCEPLRLWKRYAFLNPYYLLLLFLQWTGIRRFDTSNTEAPTHEILYG